MPTYTYRCKKCKMQFDSFQSIVDPPLKICPSCKGELERVITGGSGLIFKGSGFYITDYAKKNSSGETPKTPAKKEAESSKKEKKSD
ncbi:MAG: zinc ribbon domain-containing protein [Calditrichia bacterium]